jgi:hypothetical protein
VLLLGGIASAIGIYLFYKKTADTIEAATSGLAPLLPPPLPQPMPVDPGPAPATLSGAQTGTGVVTSPGAKAPSTATPSAGGAAAGTSTPSASTTAAPSAAPGTVIPCVKAAACCKAVFAKTPGGAGLVANCDNLRAPNEQICEQILAGQRQAASALGVSCE